MGKRAGCLFVASGFALLAGCGVAYHPQKVDLPTGEYGYQRSDDLDVEVIPLTLATAQKANADGYEPRRLPDAFQAADLGRLAPMGERLAALGLDKAEPALILDPQGVSARLRDPATALLQPFERREDRTPAPSLALSGGGVDAAARPPAPTADWTRELERRYAQLERATQLYLKLAEQTRGLSPPPAPEPLRAIEGVSDATRLYARAPSSPTTPRLDPPPAIEAEPYTLTPGDALLLSADLRSLVEQAAANRPGGPVVQRLLVQQNGQVLIPKIGRVDVGGLTLEQAREILANRFTNNQISTDFTIEIAEFGGQRVMANGSSGAKVLPITVRPLTLREAVAGAGGLGADPAAMAVRILRDGRVYEVPGEALLKSSDLGDRILKNGDAVSVEPYFNVEGAVRYFDQQMALQNLRRGDQDRLRQNYAEALSASRAELDFARERAASLAGELQALRSAIADARSAEEDRRGLMEETRARLREERDRVQFDIAMETYRLNAERMRQEAEIGRAQALREADRANEEARAANMAARQAYLDKANAILEANATEARAVERERREIERANAADRARERSERRAILQMEATEERARQDQLLRARDQERAIFEKRAAMGAMDRDYIVVAGESVAQAVVPLPFEGRLTLARALYEGGKGIDPLNGNSRQIYVIRRPVAGAMRERLMVYHLDAGNAVRLSAATAFEMRPNDVVFVNAQPVVNWNRALGQLLPFLSSANSLSDTAVQLKTLGL